MAAKTTELTVRPLDAADMDVMLDLYRRTGYLEPAFLTPEFLHWQYFSGPAGPGILYGAFDRRALAGIYNLILCRLSIRRRYVTAAYSMGTLTAPEYRRALFRDKYGLNTVFTRLAKQSIELAENRGAVMTYGFPNKMSYPGFKKFLGFQDLGTAIFLARPVWLETMLRLKFKLPRFLERACGLLAQCLASGLRSPAQRNGEFEIRPMTSAAPQLDDLQRQVEPTHAIMRVRDREFVQWRFFDHPVFHYDIVGAYRKGRLQGYLVWMVSERVDKARGLTALVACVVDYSVVPGTVGAAALEAMLHVALAAHRRRRALIAIAIGTPAVAALRVFQRCGFFAFAGKWMPRRFNAILRTHDAGADTELLSDWDRWYLTLADTDVA